MELTFYNRGRVAMATPLKQTNMFCKGIYSMDKTQVWQIRHRFQNLHFQNVNGIFQRTRTNSLKIFVDLPRDI